MATDPALVHNAPYDIVCLCDGDRDAFAAMVREESPRLLRVLVRMVGDRDAAHSIMQETFLQAYERIDTFRGDSKFTTWLYGIGINQARTWLRKRRREEELDEDGIDRLQPQFAYGQYTPSPKRWAPLEEVVRGERKTLLHRAIAQLPEHYRVIITLRDIEEMDTTETAEILELSEGNVRVRLHRARHALRSLLAPYFKEGM